jgi:hypothetical protein
LTKIPQLIIPDDRIAELAAAQWPEPTRYQARVMTTIALCETGGDAYALYLNTSGDFAGTLDRGLWAINEEAIRGLFGTNPSPALFVDPEASAKFARAVWDWRFGIAKLDGRPYAEALVFAYLGWTTYREKAGKYANVWPVLWRRAGVALGLQ